ncbi:MAG: polymerase sigma-70 factor, subfamily [Acidobacteriota bacterium]|nr:polymerase sigma-70 factor, subfamily [Acidobacteriota bacterium]
MSNVVTFRVSDLNDAPSDRDLIDRTLAGDEAAFAAIVERFQRRIYRVAFAIVRNEADADGIAQDTFVQAYTHLRKFEGRAELETWLTRIAINRSRDTLRRRRFVSLFTRSDDGEGREIMLVEPIDERPDAERQLMSRQLRVAIERAVERLSSQQKVIFRLRHYENLALEEIAEHLGLSAGTVRAHLFRAIHKVRKELSGWRSDEALQ